jgi:hypothetical protein
MWSSDTLDGLNGGGWGVFIALATILAVVVDGTPDSPVVHRTWHCSLSGVCHVSRLLGFGAVDRWSPLSSCGTGQSGAFLLHGSDFLLLHCALFTVHCSRLLGSIDRCSIGSPDMSSSHWKVRWIIVKRLWEKPESDQFVGALAWAPDSGGAHRTVSDAPLAAPMHVFCSKLCRVPNLFSLLVYVELYAPDINDN